MRRRTSPVQQWVDSLPSPAKSSLSIGSIIRQQSVSVDSESACIPECTAEQALNEKENYIGHLNMTVSTPIPVPNAPAITYPNVSRLARDPSFQSDSSHCSSVESLLELRRADPEAVLLSLGFGGGANSPQENGPLSRIPKRFLQPSKLKGIAIDEFVRHQQETSESLDSTSLGYRGLTGSPYVAPSEIVQKIMQRLREHETHEMDAYASYNNNFEPHMLPQQQEGRLSVLSPDNRQYLERPRSKSPDMRNKRMIIGQRSFAFGHDGDLIEIDPGSRQTSQESDDVFEYSNDTKDVSQMGPMIHPNSESISVNDNDSSVNKAKPKLINLKSKSSNDNMDSIEIVESTKTNPSDKNISDTYTSTLTFSIEKNYSHRETKNNSCSSGESPRRASEGFYEKSSKSSLFEEEGRRFSDGVMHSMKKSETRVLSSSSSTSSRKKSLRRQAKIRDTDWEDDIIEDVMDKSKIPTTLRLSEENRCCHCGKQPERNGNEELDEDAEVSCCYKKTSQTCWREMEKVLQKNKKLEDVVARSRREMAEIRGMLSTVLSVRMEPGF